MNKKDMRLTNEVGAPVAENENSLTFGPRGPVAMQEAFIFLKRQRDAKRILRTYVLLSGEQLPVSPALETHVG